MCFFELTGSDICYCPTAANSQKTGYLGNRHLTVRLQAKTSSVVAPFSFRDVHYFLLIFFFCCCKKSTYSVYTEAYQVHGTALPTATHTSQNRNLSTTRISIPDWRARGGLQFRLSSIIPRVHGVFLLRLTRYTLTCCLCGSTWVLSNCFPLGLFARQIRRN